MNICVDVGNTTITFGGYVDDKCVERKIINLEARKTEDEFYQYLSNFLSFAKPPVTVDNIMYSSVVPEVNAALKGALARLFKVKIQTIDLKNTKVGFTFETDNPSETGDDLVADLVGGFYKYGYPLLIVDLGTASKLLYLNENGGFASANILPGLELCAKSLSNNTSLLPNIELRPVETIIAKNTIDCINSGIVLGHIEMIEGCIRRYKKETNNEDLKVVFTGGHTFLLNNLINPNYIINANLTLDGLNKMIEINK